MSELLLVVRPPGPVLSPRRGIGTPGGEASNGNSEGTFISLLLLLVHQLWARHGYIHRKNFVKEEE